LNRIFGIKAETNVISTASKYFKQVVIHSLNLQEQKRSFLSNRKIILGRREHQKTQVQTKSGGINDTKLNFEICNQCESPFIKKPHAKSEVEELQRNKPKTSKK